jgi:hypothetical protein
MTVVTGPKLQQYSKNERAPYFFPFALGRGQPYNTGYGSVFTKNAVLIVEGGENPCLRVFLLLAHPTRETFLALMELYTRDTGRLPRTLNFCSRRNISAYGDNPYILICSIISFKAAPVFCYIGASHTHKYALLSATFAYISILVPNYPVRQCCFTLGKEG